MAPPKTRTWLDPSPVSYTHLLIDPAALPARERQLFLDFLKMADKAAAHFTVPITHDWTKTHDVVLRVHHHLKVCLYDYTGRTLRDATP